MEEKQLTSAESTTSTLETSTTTVVEANSIVVHADGTVPITIEQLTIEVNQYLGRITQNIIEVGKRLNQAKELLPHGEWLPWLKNNFNLSLRSAYNFMECAKRFDNLNLQSIANLSSTQMIAMLALPADETEQFIEAKATAGTPVKNMPVKELRKAIRQWNATAKQTSAASPIIENEKESKENLTENVNALSETSTNIVQIPETHEGHQTHFLEEQSSRLININSVETTNTIPESQENPKYEFTLKIGQIFTLCDSVLKSKDLDTFLQEYVENHQHKVESELSSLQKFIEQMKTILEDKSRVN